MPRLTIFVLLSYLAIAGCKVPKVLSDARPIVHDLCGSLLIKHVSADGWVDYPGFISDSQQLENYLELLAKHHPNDRHWSKDEQPAYSEWNLNERNSLPTAYSTVENEASYSKVQPPWPSLSSPE